MVRILHVPGSFSSQVGQPVDPSAFRTAPPSDAVAQALGQLSATFANLRRENIAQEESAKDREFRRELSEDEQGFRQEMAVFGAEQEDLQRTREIEASDRRMLNRRTSEIAQSKDEIAAKEALAEVEHGRKKELADAVLAFRENVEGHKTLAKVEADIADQSLRNDTERRLRGKQNGVEYVLTPESAMERAALLDEMSVVRKNRRINPFEKAETLKEIHADLESLTYVPQPPKVQPPDVVFREQTYTDKMGRIFTAIRGKESKKIADPVEDTVKAEVEAKKDRNKLKSEFNSLYEKRRASMAETDVLGKKKFPTHQEVIASLRESYPTVVGEYEQEFGGPQQQPQDMPTLVPPLQQQQAPQQLGPAENEYLDNALRSVSSILMSNPDPEEWDADTRQGLGSHADVIAYLVLNDPAQLESLGTPDQIEALIQSALEKELENAGTYQPAGTAGTGG